MTENKLTELLSGTLESWSKNVESYFYNNNAMKRIYEEFKDLPPSPPKEPEPWEDNTPNEQCNWFVWYGDCDESHVMAFKTKKKALLFMKSDECYGEPDLIHGKIVKVKK